MMIARRASAIRAPRIVDRLPPPTPGLRVRYQVIQRQHRDVPRASAVARCISMMKLPLAAEPQACRLMVIPASLSNLAIHSAQPRSGDA